MKPVALAAGVLETFAIARDISQLYSLVQCLVLSWEDDHPSIDDLSSNFKADGITGATSEHSSPSIPLAECEH